MRLVKIYNQGNIINSDFYERLQVLDKKIVFPNCNEEFKENRDWWVMVDNSKIVAYCGCLYTKSICIFIRCWVHKDYRGLGYQRNMIDKRIKGAKENYCHTVITYTSKENNASSNNLIKKGFFLYEPAYKYAGQVYLYWVKKI